MQIEHDIFYLAPLRGVTLRTFRNVAARWFVTPDLAVAPFIPTVDGNRVRSALLRDIDPDQPQLIPLIPQVLGKDPDQLRLMLTTWQTMGYTRADLNAGCPYPMIIKKNRGAGLLRDPDILERMLECGCTLLPDNFSLKVRLGIDTPDLLAERMDIINQYPLKELTIHARTAKQMYTGTPLRNEFGLAMELCQHPVVYNGDIFSLQDFLTCKKAFPKIRRWMIGRGAIRNPFLFDDLRRQTISPRSTEHLYGFLQEYLAECEQELIHTAPILGRLKELWSYLHHAFANGDQLWRTLRICRTIPEYQQVLETLAWE